MSYQRIIAPLQNEDRKKATCNVCRGDVDIDVAFFLIFKKRAGVYSFFVNREIPAFLFITLASLHFLVQTLNMHNSFQKRSKERVKSASKHCFFSIPW